MTSTHSIRESDFLAESTRSGVASSDWGQIQQRSQQVAPGLSLTSLQCETRRDLRVIPDRPPEAAAWVMAVSLTGHSCFETTSGIQWLFKPASHSWGLRTGHKGVRHYPAGQRISQLRLVLAPELANHYLGPVSRLLSGKISQPISNTLALSRAAQQLLHNHAHLSPLTLHQASLELLQLALPAEGSHVARSSGMVHVLALIHAGQADRLSVAELARYAGLSVRRFKQAFHEQTRQGVLQYIQQQRMLRGLQLLRQGWRVSQVAYQLGYEHPNNFSAAFLRYFGHAPRDTVVGKVA
ncbi:helix-turn-helix transcriptional regulator [Leeia aquatica]|uniref:Helix-turn-helix transcriptional regulator n=1 Tax=Leeia aquatica TaxID=2725557 RepID=A0A847S1W5_9NEIS|nr:AraC family transcriptional regulator [Leeia aquatica]NLR73714.1 helix-turn-helix transcriptional regulator [Leeia aquatica]